MKEKPKSIQTSEMEHHKKNTFKNAFYILIAVLFLCANTVVAQKSFEVKGIVKDRTNEPIIGATIKEKGVDIGTITDMNGNFTIKASSSKSILVFSYVGMVTKEININEKSYIEISLDEDNLKLDELVVTALGIKRETRALGYAISEVKGEDLTAGRESNIMSALSGKVAGVDISSTSSGPSGSTRVIIRGNSELSGSNMPLYVIDGVVMDNTQMGDATWAGGYDYGDGLSAVSPEDIESVSVLKGASAAALYGSRASNGVVLITTKSGTKKTRLGIEVSSNYGVVNLLSKFDDYQKTYGQGRYGKPVLDVTEAQGTTQSAWGAQLDPNINSYIYNGELKPYEYVPNNTLSFFKQGTVLSNSISFSGGNETSNFRASISDLRDDDIVPNSNLSRTSFMIRGSSKLGEKISIESRVNYTVERVQNRPALADSPNNIANSIIGLAPSFDQKWLSENYKDEYGRYVDWNGGNIYRMNPYWVINEMSNTSSKNRVLGFMQFNYQPTSYLNIQLKGGTDFYDFEAIEYNPLYTPTAATGKMKINNTYVNESNIESLIRFDKRFDQLSIAAFIGGNIRFNERKSFINEGVTEVQPGMKSILNYRDKILIYNASRKQVNSLYGAVNVGYRDFAYVDFTLRNDVSSTLSANYRSYTYPSVSSSFVFTSLFDFNQNILSFGKIRASWAKVGGDTNPYQLNLTYGLFDYTFQGMALGKINSTVIPNRFLKPTSTYSYEFGTDLRFFNGLITLDAGYYYKSTVDQILRLSTSLASGYNSAMINAGEIVNKGVELSLSATPVKTKNFAWNATINFANNQNEVVSLHPDVKNYQLAAARWADAFVFAMEGEAYGVIVGKGFKRDPQGNVIHANGIPLYNDTVQILGKGTYDYTLGLNQSFKYKRFSLSLLLDMKWGADIYSMSSRLRHSNGTSRNTLPGRVGWYESEEQRIAEDISLTNWIPTSGYVSDGVKNIGTDDEPIYVKNDVYVDPQVYWSNVTSNTAEPFIYDASFIKLREMNFSYSLPKSVLKKLPFESASVSFYGRNLLTLYSNVENIDPESNFSNSNGQGLEYGSLPSRRNYGIGLTVKL